MVIRYSKALWGPKLNILSYSKTFINCSNKNNNILKIFNYFDRRSQSYAMCITPYQVQEKETYSYQVFQHLKTFPDYNWDPLNLKINNVFDNSKAILKLQSIVVHSLTPTPNDVIKLFSLYASMTRISLQQVFVSGHSAKILKIRVESSIPLMSSSELYQFSKNLRSLQSLKWQFFKSLITDVCHECLSRAKEASVLSEILKLFAICVELYGTSVFHKSDSKQFIPFFEKHLNNAKPLQLIQILYFIGLSKGKFELGNIPYKAVNTLIPNFKNISFIEAGVAVSGLFKIGFKFGSEEGKLSSLIADKLKNWVIQDYKHLESLEKFSIVSLIKYLRFCCHTDLELLQILKTYLLSLDEAHFNPELVCHTIALYANSNFYDKAVYDLLGDYFFAYFKSSEKVLRFKDVSRVLWAFSHVQYKCDESSLNLVAKELEKFSQTAELWQQPNHFVDSTLALSMMNFYEEKLIGTSLNPNFLKNFRAKERSRFLSRLLVLHEVQKVIFPKTVFYLPSPTTAEIPRRTLSDESFFRPAVRNIKSALAWLEQECGFQVLQLCFLVPYINYCSVIATGRKPKTSKLPSEIGKCVLKQLETKNILCVAVEINDAHSSLIGSEKEVVGLEALKRKLLLMKGWKVRTIAGNEIESCRDPSAVAALIIKAFCDEQL